MEDRFSFIVIAISLLPRPCGKLHREQVRAKHVLFQSASCEASMKWLRHVEIKFTGVKHSLINGKGTEDGGAT